MRKIRDTYTVRAAVLYFQSFVVCWLSEGYRDWWFWELKRTPKIEHAKIPSSQTCGITQCPATPGLSTCLAAGRGAGGPLPAFTACKLWAVGDQEGARLLLRSRGGGRDSSSAGVEVFLHKEDQIHVSVRMAVGALRDARWEVPENTSQLSAGWKRCKPCWYTALS